MARKKSNTPQFDVEKSLQNRRFEKMIFHHGSLAAVIKSIGFYSLSTLIWPRFIAPKRWKLTRFNVAMPHLPRVFDGYKIAQLSDLHTGSTDQHYLRRVLETVGQSCPSKAVLTWNPNLRRRVPPRRRPRGHAPGRSQWRNPERCASPA